MSVQIYTDENQAFHKRELFASQYMPSVVTASIEKKTAVTDFWGFGVAITGSSCYLLNQMKKDECTALLKRIYSKEGLELSVGRLTIGASDYSAELYSYDDVPGDTALEHFSIARDETYIIPMIKKILKINPDLYLYASPWSPPGWMKTEGSMCGGFMREEFVECYAEYIVKYIKAYANHGIKISALTPQNEPYTDQDGRMPACIWHPEIAARFIGVLKNKLKENCLDVEIWMHDHNFRETNRVLWALDTLEGLKENCNGVAFHYYNGSIEETMILKEKYPNLKLHFTEGGPRLYENYDSDYVKWGIMISKALKCGYSSFTGWNLLLDETGNPNIGPFSCGGLVTQNSVTGEISYSGQYKALQQIAPYIKANSSIFPITTNENDCVSTYPNRESQTEGFMIQNQTGESVLVLINPKNQKQQIQFSIANEWKYAELSPNSISTIII